MFPLPLPWMITAALAATLAAGGGGYIKGRADGRAAEAATYAQERADAEAATREALQKITESYRAQVARADAIAGQAAARRQADALRLRALRQESRRVAQMAFYSGPGADCLDADGLRLVAAAAGGDATAAPADPGQPAATMPGKPAPSRWWQPG